MNYFKIQITCLLLIGLYCVTSYAQNTIVQNFAAPPTASNFAYPQSVFVDSYSGHIWVTDFDNNRVLRFDVSTLTAIDESGATSVLTNYYLEQNYPNPFNPSTKISWQSSVGSWQTLKVYDVLGNELVTLVNEYKPAGSYEVEFNVAHSAAADIRASGVSATGGYASGIYFYQLSAAGGAGSFIQTKKMVLIR